MKSTKLILPCLKFENLISHPEAYMDLYLPWIGVWMDEGTEVLMFGYPYNVWTYEWIEG